MMPAFRGPNRGFQYINKDAFFALGICAKRARETELDSHIGLCSRRQTGYENVVLLEAVFIPMKIRKAVLPVAGLGTRVLPATKAMPKEMLTIVDKPLIQYVVDEAKEAGIEHFIFVTGRNKGVIEDHFDRMFELDTTLAARGKKAEMEILARDQPEAGAMSFTRQQAPLGLGHAVWCARDIVGNEPFAVVLPDELVLHTPGCLAQMIEAANKLGDKSNLIAVEAVPDELTHQYGICGVGKRNGKVFEVDGMVEKPPKGTAPSNLSITGRYILQPEIFKILQTQERGAGGEIQLTDAMIGLSKTQKFYGVEFAGERHDCGSKAGFLRANIAFGMARPELRDGLRAEMKKHSGK
jgi:UTP--glucose-1-phosphate uridylyltransferase